MSVKTGLPADKSITVADYSQQFFERVKQRKYGQTEEENSEVAGQNFYGLIAKLQETGSKDDVKVPLRVLRDEIGRAYFTSGAKETAVIETLFKLYDAVESRCQLAVRNQQEAKEAAAAIHLLEELRMRFSRLAVGDTWEAYPELRLKALKRMQLYAVRERELKASGAATQSSAPGKSKKTMKRMMSMGSGASPAVFASWQATIDDLAKAPAARLFPFVKLLLQESVEGAETVQAQPSEGAMTGELPAAPEAAQHLPPAPSTASEALGVSQTGHSLAELKLDDLLGLNDPTPVVASAAAPTEAVEPPQHHPASADPFAVQALPPQGSTAHALHTPNSQAADRANPFNASIPGSATQGQPGSPAMSASNGSYVPAPLGSYQSYGNSHPQQGYGPPGIGPGAMSPQPAYQPPRRQSSESAQQFAAYQPTQPAFGEQASHHPLQQPPQPQGYQFYQQQAAHGQRVPPLPVHSQVPQLPMQQQQQQQQFPVGPPHATQHAYAQQAQPAQYSPNGLARQPSHPQSPGFVSATSATFSDPSSAYVSSPHSHAPASQPFEPQLQAEGSGSFNPSTPTQAAHPQAGAGRPQPPASQPAPQPSSWQGSQNQAPSASPFSAGFEPGAFGSSQAYGTAGGTPPSTGAAGSGSFNPFGLQEAPSQEGRLTAYGSASFKDQASYAGSQTLPPFSDNRFSDVGPVVPPGQHHNIPQPMRAPPAPPTSGSTNQFSAW